MDQSFFRGQTSYLVCQRIIQPNHREISRINRMMADKRAREPDIEFHCEEIDHTEIEIVQVGGQKVWKSISSILTFIWISSWSEKDHSAVFTKRTGAMA